MVYTNLLKDILGTLAIDLQNINSLEVTYKEL